MQLVPRKYFLMFLAAVLVVAFGFMALALTNRPEKKIVMTESEKEIQQITKQGNGDGVEEIENDLNETDVVEVDRELQDIESEIEATY